MWIVDTYYSFKYFSINSGFTECTVKQIDQLEQEAGKQQTNETIH